MSTLFDTASKIAKDAVDSPLTVLRKLGLNIPSKSDISTGIKTIAEDFSPAADIKEMVEGSEKISEGNPMSGLAQLVGGAFGAAIPFSGRVRATGKVIGDIADKKLLDMKYTRETPKKKGAFSSMNLAAEGKITDQEAIGGLFNPYTIKNKEMILGPDSSNLNSSRIEISTFPPPGEKIPGFGMKSADDIGLPASEVGNRIDDNVIEVQTNLIEGSKWKWEGKVPKGFKNNTHLVSMKGGSKLKKASKGPTGHSYATKVIYEKGGNLSTYDTRAEYVKELHKSIPESLAALKIKIPKEVKKVTKELKAEGKSTEEIKEKVNSLKKKLTRDYKGDNPKGKPTTVGIPEFGKKIGDIKKGGIIQPVYDQIIMREAGGQIMPMQYGGGLDDAYMTLSQRRNSAFADPNANSAFASPISQGGLPTIYREDGGTTIPKERMINDQPHQLSYINPEEAGLLQALGGSGRMVDGVPSYFWSDDTGDGGYTDDGDDGVNDAAAYSNAGGNDDGTYNLGQLEALDRSEDPSPEPEDIANLFGEDLPSIRAAMNAGRARDAEDRASGYLSPDTTYRTSGRGGNVSEIRAGWEKFGTPEIAKKYIRNLEGKYGRDEATTRVAAALASPGGVQALESGTGTGDTIAGLIDAIQESDDLGRQRQRSYEGIKEERSLKDTLKSLLPFGVEVDPRIKKANEEYAKRQGGIQTPEGFFSKAARGLAGAIAPPIGMFQTGLALAGKSPAGTFSIDGLDFNVAEDGTSSFNDQAMFDDNIDYGNDAPDKKPILEEKKKVVKDLLEDESLMKDFINKAKEERVDPNIQIIMDIYGYTFDEAEKFLGKKTGIGTGGVGEFEGI